MNINFPGEILRDVNEKLLIASVRQHELAELASEAEQRLSALVNGVNAVICEISILTGEIGFLSEKARLFLGYERSSWNRRGFWRRVIHPDDRAATVAALYGAIRSRRDLDHEFRVVTRDGHIVWVRNSAVLVTETDGTPRLLRCVIVNISRTKEAEASIAISERRFRRLFEATREGILLLDRDTGAITDANQFASDLLGVPRQTLLGKDFYDVGLFALKEEGVTAFSRLQTERTVHFDSLPLRSPESVGRTVELLGNVYLENGHSVIQCHIRDVTERRRAELLQAEALEREQNITESLQRPLLGNFREDAFPGLALSALYEPALKEAEVGGDFFDVFVVGTSVETRRTVLCVGDVMGKGLKAASLAARIKEVTHAFMGENADPAHTLFRLNQYLCDTLRGANSNDLKGMFDSQSLSALSIAVIEPETGNVVIATAGAEPVSILRAEGHLETAVTGGVTLGIQHDEPFVNARFTLQVGDTLVMTTDGLTEARNGREFLNHEGLMAIALEHAASNSVASLGQAIVRDARAFGGRFNDDICLLLARYTR